ncbi:hypothetical protein HCN44_006500 [Aphidius gifuensis]|uniref:C2H2-type domain-containing protein n=1 Tax=Aphidius gifuensis TaxID=684658 RepID=A0A834Y0A1_APHGI|nr:hypothetical protein HCN44_006500 [Aphidius gifuensis]
MSQPDMEIESPESRRATRLLMKRTKKFNWGRVRSSKDNVKEENQKPKLEIRKLNANSLSIKKSKISDSFVKMANFVFLFQQINIEEKENRIPKLPEVIIQCEHCHTHFLNPKLYKMHLEESHNTIVADNPSNLNL